MEQRNGYHSLDASHLKVAYEAMHHTKPVTNFSSQSDYFLIGIYALVLADEVDSSARRCIHK